MHTRQIYSQNKEQQTVDRLRFTIFSFFFALSTVSYYAQLRPGLSVIPDTLTLFIAGLVLLKPSSAFRFLTLVLAQTASVYLELPASNTNRILMFFVGITILMTTVLQVVSSRSVRIVSDRLIQTFQPVLRLELLIVYFFTFWHKLNSEFVHPQTSCGTALFNQLIEAFGGMALFPVMIQSAAVLLTLLVEGLIPVLLVLRSTRTAGVILGMLFHFVLGLAWFYSFSATMMAVLFLYTPDNFEESIRNWWKTQSLNLYLFPRLVKFTIWAIVLVFAVYAAWLWNTESTFPQNINRAWVSVPHRLFWFLWFLYLIPIGILCRVLWSSRPCYSGPSRLLFAYSPLYLIFPILVIFNGLCPYLGLKTEGSFAMYSNLRTEGGESNHLIIRKPFYIADYQSDLVLVLRSSDQVLAKLARRGEPVPFYVLRERIRKSIARGSHGIQLNYIRKGKRHSLAAAEKDPDLTKKPSYLEAKLLRFRFISQRCAH